MICLRASWKISILLNVVTLLEILLTYIYNLDKLKKEEVENFTPFINITLAIRTSSV